jgi:hypothetical protein
MVAPIVKMNNKGNKKYFLTCLPYMKVSLNLLILKQLLKILNSQKTLKKEGIINISLEEFKAL